MKMIHKGEIRDPVDRGVWYVLDWRVLDWCVLDWCVLDWCVLDWCVLNIFAAVYMWVT